jgi:hypothetical protein
VAAITRMLALLFRLPGKAFPSAMAIGRVMPCRGLSKSSDQGGGHMPP